MSIFTEDKYIEFYFILDDHITVGYVNVNCICLDQDRACLIFILLKVLASTKFIWSRSEQSRVPKV